MELWKDYLHKENRKVYSVSNYGRIKSLDVKGNLYYHTTYKNNGYRCIPYRKPNGKNGLIYVHKIMLLIWVENPNNYKRYRFKDGNYSNCTADNLEWISDEFFSSLVKKRASESYKQSEKRTYPTNARLSMARVAILKKRILENEKKEKKMKWTLLAKQFDIDYAHLYKIRTGRMWKNVAPAP